jgi:hypothetical protein
VIIGVKHQNEQFFSYIKAMRQKEIKAPIIYITVHIPTSILTLLFQISPIVIKISITLFADTGSDWGSITCKCNRLHYNYCYSHSNEILPTITFVYNYRLIVINLITLFHIAYPPKIVLFSHKMGCIF